MERVDRHLDAAEPRGRDAAGAVRRVRAEPGGVEQAAALRLAGQPGRRSGGRGTGVGAEPHLRQRAALERQREPDAVVAGAAAGPPLAVGALDGTRAPEVDHATLSAARRSPCRIRPNAARNASTSPAVVSGPSVTRTAPRAVAASMPIASRT